MSLLQKIKNNLSYTKEELILELERLYSLESSSKLHHIAFNVGNVRDTVDFYLKNIDAEVLFCTDSRACIVYNGVEICFTEGTKHPTHIAFEVKSLDDMPDFDEAKTHSDNSSYIYLKDEYGNAIEWICFE
jgi:hypothetical protein